MTSWPVGKEEISDLLKSGYLVKIPANEEFAENSLQIAETHLKSVKMIISSDPTGAYQLAYDAARKAGAALLAMQGLRAKSESAHVTVAEAVKAQFNGPDRPKAALGKLSQLKRLRTTAEYPSLESGWVTDEDAQFGLELSESIVHEAREALTSGKLDVFLN